MLVNNGALHGLIVVDLTRALAGPFTSPPYLPDQPRNAPLFMVYPR